VREAIYTAEGRLFNNAGTNRYEYTIKDHLGNARISFTDKNGNNTIEYSNGEVLQENHYYPFGLAYEGPWVNDAARDNMYQYNGKEINDDFGLNLNDYGARWYDASVGRFLAVDKFADGYVGFSPFSYVANNPLKFIDVNGDYIDIYNPQGEFVMSIDDGKKKAVGLYFKQSCIDDNGKEKFSNGIAFEYNDEKEDRENATKNGFIVKESSDKDIQSAVMQGTLDAFRNSENSIKYVERESRPKGDESVLSGKSEGKLDYFGSYPDVAPGVVLQIVVNKKGNKAVAYNPKDYGNFLWGRSVKFLGLPYSFAKAGSQLNNIFNSGSDNPSLDREFLDSEGDQRAIYNGYYHHVKEPKNGINADQYKSGIK
jgi:RHS repeat-associated protein